MSEEDFYAWAEHLREKYGIAWPVDTTDDEEEVVE
jgi:hypothetical protein